MKTLLQLNSVVNFGSTGRICEEIGKVAIKSGWNSIISYGRYNRQSSSKLIKIGTEIDSRLHFLQTRIFDNHALGSHKSTMKFIHQIESINPDIVHLHNLHGYYINIKDLFSYLSDIKKPIVWTLHDCWSITGHCTFFDSIRCSKWKTLCHNCPQKNKYPSSYFLDNSKQNYLLKKELFNSVDNMTLVPVSKWLSNYLNESFLNKYPIKIINNGIDVNFFTKHRGTSIRKKYNIENKFIILGVANIWDPRKGFLDFLKLSKLIDNDCVIVLIGLSPKQVYKLPPNVIGLGRTENMNELADFFSSADVFVNPTYEDNFPTTNIEALASGTPVISYDTGGSIESITENTGFVVEQGNLEELMKAILNCKRFGKKHFSSSCIDMAVVKYNKNERYMDYIKLYNEILK